MRVLVAGEQHEFGDLLLPFLAKKGHTLLFAQTVDELLGRVRSELLDVIIMDLDLPAKDSFTGIAGPSGGNLKAGDCRCR